MSDINMQPLEPLAQRRGQTVEEYVASLRPLFKGMNADQARKCIGDIVRHQLCPLAGELWFMSYQRTGEVKCAVTIDGFYNLSQRYGMSIKTKVFTEDEDLACWVEVSQPAANPSLPPIKHELTEWLSECQAQARSKQNWEKMPKRMLRHRAVGQAIRMACGSDAAPVAEELMEAGFRKVTSASSAEQAPTPKVVELPSDEVEVVAK